MKVICDTNIWYYLARNPDKVEYYKQFDLCPNYLNIAEVGATSNIITNLEEIKQVIQVMMEFQQNTNFHPPYIHLAKLINNFDYNIQENVGPLLQFTTHIANNGGVNIANFDTYIINRKTDFQNACDWLNNYAQEIRPKVPNRKLYLQSATVNTTAGFVDHIVRVNTNNEYNLDNLEMRQTELLLRGLDYFFKKVVINRKMKIVPNDWFDFSMLSYVQPGMKYWTKERRWLSIIEECGMKSYLVDPNIF